MHPLVRPGSGSDLAEGVASMIHTSGGERILQDTRRGRVLGAELARRARKG